MFLGPVSGWHAEPVDGELGIRLLGVVKALGPVTAVNGLDLDVPDGTCVGLLGLNGAGKSTTMRLLTGGDRCRATARRRIAPGRPSTPRAAGTPRSSARSGWRTRRRRDSRVDKLSGGMRRRLLIARGARPPGPARPAQRAHRRPRSAGAPGAVRADRRAARRGHHDPHVYAPHRRSPASSARCTIASISSARGLRLAHLGRRPGRRPVGFGLAI